MRQAFNLLLSAPFPPFSVPPGSSATPLCACFLPRILINLIGPERCKGKCEYACLRTSHRQVLSSFYEACVTFYPSHIKPLIVTREPRASALFPPSPLVSYLPCFPSTPDPRFAGWAEITNSPPPLADLNMLKSWQSRDLSSASGEDTSNVILSTTIPPFAASIARSRLPRQSAGTKSRREKRTHYHRGCRTSSWPHAKLQTMRKRYTRDGQIFLSRPWDPCFPVTCRIGCQGGGLGIVLTRRLTMILPFVPCSEDKVSSLPMALSEQSFQPWLLADLSNV